METRRCKKCDETKPHTSDNFRKNKHTCKPCEREASRKRSFKIARGISHEERDMLFEEQGFKCAACGNEDAGSTKGWHVDHCHSTGKIRGILCSNCNVALGHSKDSIERLESLINYLRRHQE